MTPPHPWTIGIGLALAAGLAGACLTDPATYVGSGGAGSTSTHTGASSTGKTTSSSASGVSSSNDVSSSSDASSSGAGGGPPAGPVKIYIDALGDEKDQQLEAAAADDSGNVYIGGTWQGVTPPKGLGSWLHGCTGANTNHAFVAKLSPAGVPLWAECLSPEAAGLALSYDKISNQVALAGSYKGTLSGYPPADVTSQGVTDGFVVRLDSDGAPVSVATMGGPLDDEITGVVAAMNETLIVGTYRGTATFGTSGGDPHTAAGGEDLFYARAATGGTFSFVKVYPKETALTLSPKLVASSTSTIHIAGEFDGTLDFEGGTTPLTASGGTDGFLATLDYDGNPSFAARYGGPGADAIRALSATASTIAVGGAFSQTIDFDGPGGQMALTSVVSPDAFLAVFTNTHVLKKQQPWGAGDAQRVDAVRVRGNTLVGGGRFTGTVDFGGTQLTALDQDGFAFHADTSGTLSWVVQLGDGSGRQWITAADHAATGLNFFGGAFDASFMFEGKLIQHTGTSGSDILIAAFED